MLRTIFTASVAATILALSATVAFAQTELDNEKAYTNFSSDASKGTVILKVDNTTGAMAILNAGKNITSNEEAQKLAMTGAFVPVAANKIVPEKGELDQTQEIPGWYVMPRRGFYPTFGWGGFWAQPNYAWAANNSNYYFYNNGNYGAWNTGWDGSQGWNGQVPYPNEVGVGWGWNTQPVVYAAAPVYANAGWGWGGAYYGGGYYGGGFRGGYGFGIGGGGFRGGYVGGGRGFVGGGRRR